MAANDALAVKQALLAEKTSKHYAQASLLYLRANGMADVARLMDESQAGAQGRAGQGFRSVAQENRREAQRSAKAKSIRAMTSCCPRTSGAGAGEKQLLGGDEGTAPERYKKQVADYYRSLAGGNE